MKMEVKVSALGGEGEWFLTPWNPTVTHNLKFCFSNLCFHISDFCASVILKPGNQPEYKRKFKQTQIYKKWAFKSIREIVGGMKILMITPKFWMSFI